MDRSSRSLICYPHWKLVCFRRSSIRTKCYIPVMLCGFMCFALYSISLLSCCSLDQAQAGLDPSLRRHHSQRHHVALASSHEAVEDEVRYQRDLEEPVQGFTAHLRRKTLVEDHLNTLASKHPKTVARDVISRGGDNDILGDTYDDENSDTEEDSQQAYDEVQFGHSHQRGSRTQRRRYPGDEQARPEQDGVRRLPEAIIIGVKKGGTRAMLEFLRVHPDVRAPGPETHFFDKNYHMGLEWYRQQMPPALDSQITIEKTPSYFVTKGVPGRIYNMSKDTKLIVVVRDPVTRAISDYTQALSKRTDIKPFEQMAFLDNSTRVVDTSWGAVKIGVYAKHLERWLQYFPMEQIHFANGEKLIEEPAQEMAKVQDFLGLKRVISDKHFYFNTTKGFPCLKKPEGSGSPHCLGKTKGRLHPIVDPQVLQRLRDFFRPFNQKFYQMCGIDFGWS